MKSYSRYALCGVALALCFTILCTSMFAPLPVAQTYGDAAYAAPKVSAAVKKQRASITKRRVAVYGWYKTFSTDRTLKSSYNTLKSLEAKSKKTAKLATLKKYNKRAATLYNRSNKQYSALMAQALSLRSEVAAKYNAIVALGNAYPAAKPYVSTAQKYYDASRTTYVISRLTSHVSTINGVYANAVAASKAGGSGGTTPTTPTTPGTTSNFTAAEIQVIQETILRETNVIRANAKTDPTSASYGVDHDPLVLDPILCDAAMKRAKELDFLTGGTFSHTRPNGAGFYTILFPSEPTNKYLAENIACRGSDGTPNSAVVGWFNSVNHRTNMEQPYSKTLGVGVFYANDGTRYYVQVFSKLTSAELAALLNK